MSSLLIRSSLCLWVAALAGCGGSSAYDPGWDAYDLRNQGAVDAPSYGGSVEAEQAWAGSDSHAVTGVALSAREDGRSDRSGTRTRAEPTGATPPPMPPPSGSAPAGGPGLATGRTTVASSESAPPLDEPGARLPLLIYTGAVVLAIYDVDGTKEAAVALAESLGGYAAQRTDHALVIRVPAPRFREALDRLGELGDVLSLTWDAADVTDEFDDLETRLRNAVAMRARLEELLAAAENVSDALAIERELERITLDIERLEGRRREMVDRIAFATITISFSRVATNEVPGGEYRLPFPWLNQIGVERLLSL